MKTNQVKRISTFMAFLLIFSLTSISYLSASAAYTPKHQDEATALYNIGLFKGSSAGFNLDKVPTRVEAAVMLVRLLGKEHTALTEKQAQPFTDVPDWASDYVGYLYANKLTNGIGNHLFGSNNAVSWKDYCTFVLRSLNYSDGVGDFSYDTSVDKAIELKLLSGATGTFLRDDMVGVSYSALKTQTKDSSKTLGQTLIDTGAISETDAISNGIIASSDASGQNNIEAKFKALNLTEINSDALVVFVNPYDRSSITTYIKRQELPSNLQSFVNIAVCQFGKEENNDLQIKKVAIEYSSGCFMKYNTAGYGSLNIDTAKNNVMVLLYDGKGILMGYHVLTDADFSKKANCFVDYCVTFASNYYSPENSGQSRTLLNSFTVTRKINGVVDPDFRYEGGCTSQNHIKIDSDYISGLTFQYLYYEPGYTYEFASSDPNVQIQNVTMTNSSY